jgi:hypothetical protein
MPKYLINLKKKGTLGFYVTHINRNGISYCGLVKEGPQVLASSSIDYDCVHCSRCKYAKEK